MCSLTRSELDAKLIAPALLAKENGDGAESEGPQDALLRAVCVC